MARLVVFLLSASVGCAHGEPAVVRPLPPPKQDVSREEVRLLGKRHCGTCHQGSIASAKPAALAVFDLDKECWSSRMSSAQLQGFFERMNGELDDVTRPRVQAFVARVLARRAHGSAP
jgi:hypothetical protein